jgi:alkanesulfonate monooxygenase SsuD/methylene tetrahydromethanopterin reductase-like flavin-dependent oxidoreductase (luciferase family)
MTADRQMKLGAFFHPTGHHIASWRHPDAYAGAAVDFAHYTQLAQTAERGKFDLLFLADSPAMRNWPPERQSRVATYIAGFEPITLLSALAAVTKHIGLVATATTTYNEPLHIARKFASLDHISGGRAGWNLVTSTNPKEAARRRISPTTTATTARASSPKWCADCGTPGTRTRSCATRSRAAISTRRG